MAPPTGRARFYKLQFLDSGGEAREDMNDPPETTAPQLPSHATNSTLLTNFIMFDPVTGRIGGYVPLDASLFRERARQQNDRQETASRHSDKTAKVPFSTALGHVLGLHSTAGGGLPYRDDGDSDDSDDVSDSSDCDDEPRDAHASASNSSADDDTREAVATTRSKMPLKKSHTSSTSSTACKVVVIRLNVIAVMPYGDEVTNGVELRLFLLPPPGPLQYARLTGEVRTRVR